MTYDDIITLAKAGFTAYQISSLMNVQNRTQAQTAVQQVQAQPAAQAQPALQTPYNSPDHILQAINSVNDTMRQMQINMSNQPKRETTDDIIAAIINPPMPQKKGDN